MRIAYFDCFSGASGDMFIGSLMDAGLSLDRLKQELSKLGDLQFTISAAKGMKGALSGTKFDVEAHEGHIHRHLRHIVEMIDGSELSDGVKAKSKAIFEHVATVEAGIHQSDVQKVHFHEVGALDSIIDIVGSVVALELLGIDAVYCSKVHVGTGFVECQHGTIPVPAPATLELLKGIPIYSRGIEAELVTPTGAALLKNISRDFGAMPPMRVESVGYGLGTRDLEIPNMLRVTIGENDSGGFDRDQVALIETNLDDANPEILSHACQLLSERGALDVFMTPIVMKKGRLGTMLSVLTTQERLNKCLETVFAETTALGVRLSYLDRRKLFRETRSVDTKFGKIDVKLAKSGEETKNIAPEYESCRKVAADLGVPLKQIYDEAKSAAEKQLLDD
ncbi:nickel pincer cofactor biosynthesis protein LarC [bacterium]|nr:nickel pincer cofactor biosynthesis protein LarC [bacterium]